MAVRFRKSIKIAPGIKINLNKKSTSMTIGGKGFHKTFSSTGKTTTTVGVPGTGLYYTETTSGKRRKKENRTFDDKKTEEEMMEQILRRNSVKSMKVARIIFIILGIISLLISLILFTFSLIGGILFLVVTAFLFYMAHGYKKIMKFSQSQATNNTEHPSSASINSNVNFSSRQEQDYLQAKEAEQTSLNPKFHRSKKDDELAFQFYQKWQETLYPMENAFQDAYREAFTITDPEEQILKYQEALELYNKAKTFCYSKGKGGQIHFQDSWEHLHNSQNDCFSFEDKIQESMHNVQDLHFRIIPAILKEIEAADGELLQKDIYPLIPNTSKNHIQAIIRSLEQEGKISREKKGSTYKLSINTD